MSARPPREWTLRGAAGLAGLRLAGFVLVFGQAVVLTRVFGAEVFGVYSLALTVAALAGLAVSVGLDQLLMRELAAAGGPGPGAARVAPLLRYTLRLVAALTLATTLCGCALLWVGGGGLYAVPLAAVALTFPLHVLRKFTESLALGASRRARSFLGSGVAFPGAMIGGALLVWALGLPRDALVLSALYAGSLAISAAAAALLVRSLLGGLATAAAAVPGLPPADERRAARRAGLHLALVSAGLVLGQHIDFLLLGVMATPADVAFARVASRLAEAIGVMRVIAVLQFRPSLAEAHGAGDAARLRRQSRGLSFIYLATGLPLCLGAWVFAAEILALFGPEFAGTVWVLRLYVLGVFATLVCGEAPVLLAMTGHERVASRLVWASVAINAVLDVALIPAFGALGCAIATAVSLSFLGLATALAALRRTGIDTTCLALLRRPAPG